MISEKERQENKIDKKTSNSDKKQEQYNPREAEKRILDLWNKEKIFKFAPDSKKPIYSIDTPPPYISGKMHIGHAFSYSQQDFIVRFMRMFKGNIFYPFGTDDNGLPTERFVEKTNKVKSVAMPRARFIELCLKTIKETTGELVQDWKDLGLSADFERYYSTIDKNAQKISQKSFIDLYKIKEAYKKEFPTLWCCECQTAIAQAELEDKEFDSLFSTLKFSVGGKDLLIATTRPELIGACVAVFVNPEDKRYKNLIGKKAKVPLFGFEVPILADESASMEKGTGVLMVCSYGDRFDAEAIAKHKLKPRIIIDKFGGLLLEEYKGLKIKEARRKILEDLKIKGLVTEQKSISHIVNVHDRCGTEIEVLPTEQWFIKILDKKEKLIEQGKKIKWYPEFMFKRYENWIKGLEWDWNISRNRHFGVPFPVWECSKCKEILLAEEKELPVDPLQLKKKCPKCKIEAVGEKMVMDTWATSSMSPQIASSLSEGKVRLPLSLRPQGHDIIRTWAFYTIIKAYLHNKEIPWKDIIISGNVSLKGEKMSKSKGNIISPREILEKYSADALRYWASSSKLGEDLDYQEKELIAGTRFINKIFNATRFVFSNIKGDKITKPKNLLETDRLFLNKLNELIIESTKNFEEYNFSQSRLLLDKFFWHDFCDNYLEIVKNRVYNGTIQEKESAKYVLYNSLLVILKIIAPITPFITEELYQTYFKEREEHKSIHISDWPRKIDLKVEKDDKEKLGKLFDIIEKIRRIKSENKKSMKAEIILHLPKEDKKLLEDCLSDLKAVSCSREIREGDFKVEFL